MNGFSILNRNVIKYIAIVAMLLDHVAVFFVPKTMPLYYICRIIGRLTCPIMCYFLAEGFIHTSSKRNYLIRLLVFAVISQFAYIFARYQEIFTIKFVSDFNVIFTLLISFIVLLSFQNIKNIFLKWTTIVLLIAMSYICDWGIFAPIIVLIFYIFRTNKNRQVLFYVFASIVDIIVVILYWILNGKEWYREIWQLGIFLFIPFIYLYNGEGGRKNNFNKWFFYIFYPLHLIILGLIRILT